MEASAVHVFLKGEIQVIIFNNANNCLHENIWLSDYSVSTLVCINVSEGDWVSYSISQEICTRFCCALLCCGYAIVHNEFTCIMNSQVFIHIHQGCFAGTGAIVRLPQCQWSKPDGYGTISQQSTAKHSKAKTVCIFFGIYCTMRNSWINSLKPNWLSKLKICLADNIHLANPCSQNI